MEKEGIRRQHDSKSIKIISLIIIIFIFSYLSVLFFNKSVNTKTKIDFNYNEAGDIKYKVYLKDNPFYENNYLDEGMQYVAGLIDYVDINYNYVFSSSLLANFSFDYDVIAKLVVSDKDNGGKVLFTKEKVLVNKEHRDKKGANSFAVTNNVKVNYDSFNKLADEFKKEYAVSTDSYLLVSLNIYNFVNDEDHFENVPVNNSLTVTIPLSKNTIDISKGTFNKDGNTFVMSNTEIVNKAWFIIYVLVTGADIFFIIYLYLIIRKILLTKVSPYNKELRRILKNYDRAIVKTTKEFDISKYNIIEVENIEELIDARDNLSNMILYLNKVEGAEAWFLVLYEENAYRYILKASDINTKKK